MAESYMSTNFPSQVVSDKEKLSLDYGLKIGKAIEGEWFKRDSGVNRFASTKTTSTNLDFMQGENKLFRNTKMSYQ